ncbi:SWIM zinc finger family protein [Hymenobacter wooponensis]|uniref:SWIM zinc finger family protein n=1 Tax=Hymenobacter wooponensis TaxID=1525360 RepID=A0A4Z0ML50_9BACT|nr:SWIM zinc finger family protein [Hymenobacter wooponensis]TGD80216.1 SWIM zinc finger family protein [Hymenobacter wooponensis]
MTWTEAQARALITDPGTLKRGQELAATTKWSNLGQTETAAWGECKGSGSKPYQTGIDLTEPAFKCSCPSRVFPCKHGAGLLLLLARQPQLLNGATPPPWLQEWLDKRQQTQSKKPATPAEDVAATSDDTAATATAATDAELARKKRESQRLSRMQQGAAELETWLVDLMRAGLAATESQPPSFWESQAARLVDNQLPGLATVLRDLAGVRHLGPTWPERLLGQVGELYLLARTARNLEHLPAETRQEILQQLGVTSKKEEVLATQPAVADQWLVLSQTTTEEERLLVRRSWLQGQETDRFALIVEFSFGGQAFSTPLLPAGRYAGRVTFYPGLLPLRAVPGELTFLGTSTLAPVGYTTPAQLLEAYATGLARQPWLRELPALLAGGVPLQTTTGAWVLQFSANEDLIETSAVAVASSTVVAGPYASAAPEAAREVLLPLTCDELYGWQLRAVSGGYPLTVFGEWTGAALRPLAYWPSPVATIHSA